MLSEGTTSSTCPLPISFAAMKASFSQPRRTSPMPRCTKVVVEPRAPVSRTGTDLYSLVTNSFAFSSSPPLRLRAYAPSGEVVPAAASRRLGIRRDDAHARFHEIFPFVNPLRIAFAHKKDDRRRIG